MIFIYFSLLAEKKSWIRDSSFSSFTLASFVRPKKVCKNEVALVLPVRNCLMKSGLEKTSRRAILIKEDISVFEFLSFFLRCLRYPHREEQRRRSGMTKKTWRILRTLLDNEKFFSLFCVCLLHFLLVQMKIKDCSGRRKYERTQKQSYVASLSLSRKIKIKAVCASMCERPFYF